MPVTILFDTSILAAAIVEPHRDHGRAFPWLKRAKAKEFHLVVANHTLAELYAVLTAMPLSPKISPALALPLIRENVEGLASMPFT